MLTNKEPIADFQWASSSLNVDFSHVFPVSKIQRDNLNVIFGKAENLSRVAPAFYKAVIAAFPKTVKVAETTQAIQKLIDSGVYKFITDKNGEILPSIYSDKKIVAQVRLKDLAITPDLASSIVDLQTQIALAQIISEIRDVQRSITDLHNELQDDRLALADSALQQLQQVNYISDSRVREQKLLDILGKATDAKCILFRAFSRNKQYFDERKDKNKLEKLIDVDIQLHGSAKSDDIFSTLLAITKSVQVETTAYCLLGEQNSARQSMKQFSDFINENSLDDRDTILFLNSFGDKNHDEIINTFNEIQQKIAALPFDLEETQPLIDTKLIIEEDLDE
jgi:hypothetical protein